MSRQSHLPPRCPFQAKSKARLSNDHCTPKHENSASQSFILEQQPPWFDDILSKNNKSPKITPLRRSVSDPVTLLDGLVLDEFCGSNESVSGLESSCVYGPNSPRSRGNVDLSGNVVVSRLNDYFSRKPAHYLESCVNETRVVQSGITRCAGGSAEVAHLETNAAKRQSVQRSRVRKLQYIAELERTVDTLKSLESELAFKVASLLEHRVALLMENNTLKQQLMMLEQKKLLVDGQYKSLKQELEKLKYKFLMGINSADCRPSSVSDEVDCEAVWQMLKIGKLNINQ